MRHVCFLAVIAAMLVPSVSGCSPHDGRADATGSTASQASSADSGRDSQAATPARFSCMPGADASPYMGTYTIASVDKYGGGLSSAEQARARVGQSVVLSREAFKSTWDDTEVANPVYTISCFAVARKEGEVPSTHWGAHWSNFYGFAPERKMIAVLEIRGAGNNGKAPDYWYEIVPTDNGVQLWNLYDGWLYRMDKAN